MYSTGITLFVVAIVQALPGPHDAALSDDGTRSPQSSAVFRSIADPIWSSTDAVPQPASRSAPAVPTRSHACLSPVRMRNHSTVLTPAAPSRSNSSTSGHAPSTSPQIPPTPTPNNFTLTINASFPGIPQTNWYPPDVNLAVGPNHVVSLVNETIAFYDKTGNLQFSQITNTNGNPGFWTPVGASGNVFDAKVTYDQYSHRFVMVGLEFDGTDAYLDLAVSDDSDPNGTWYEYRTLATTNLGGTPYWLDYPGLGIDKRGIYVTANLFDIPSSSSFGGTFFRVFDKAPLLSGSPATYTDLVDTNVYSVQAVHEYGSTSVPLFVSEFGSPTVVIQAILNPLTAPTLVRHDVTVPAYSYPSSAVPQAGTTNGLDPLDARMINGAFRAGRLWFGHGVEIGGKNVARWYQVALNGWPASAYAPSLVQSGNIDAGNDSAGSPIHTWFPTLTLNECRDVGVVVARSSANEFAGTYLTGRRHYDPLGTMLPLVALHVGTAGYDLGRWGDFFGIAVDPSDDWTFWATGEDAVSSNTWETWIGSFNVTLRPCMYPLPR